ncbi:TonB-dependent receptor domain-containing protein [Puia sp. P3]|uniref:TonB-dependent receptor domain-containing protein n=1 Tax=Puia sp. P3 TaxID=3423952 RepID=UPI003D668B49
MSVDYYHKTTTNLLQAPQGLSSAGSVASPAFENNGKIVNRGFEFEASYRQTINKDWSFDVGGNLTTIHNEVLALLNNQPIPAGRVDNNTFATSTAVGHPVGAFYMLQADGIFQTPLEVFTHAYQGPGIRPGDLKFHDVNGDGTIDQNDRVYAGSPIPDLTYALTGHVTYKNFDMSLFFQGVSGDKIYNQIGMDIQGILPALQRHRKGSHRQLARRRYEQFDTAVVMDRCPEQQTNVHPVSRERQLFQTEEYPAGLQPRLCRADPSEDKIDAHLCRRAERFHGHQIYRARSRDDDQRQRDLRQ